MSLKSFKVRSQNVRDEIARLHKQLSDHQQLEIQLTNTLEELHVHQEELRTQNADLIAAQAEIAQSHRKYLNLFDHAPIGYFVIDRNGLIQEANLLATKLLDQSRSSLLKKPLWLYIHKQDREHFRKHIRIIMEGSPAVMEAALLRQDQKNITVELHSIPVSSSDAGWDSIRIAVLDATKRIEAERRLREINQQLDSIMATIPDIVFRLNQDGFIEYISPRANHYGYEPSQLLNRYILHLVPRQDRAKMQQHFTDLLQDGKPIHDLEIQVQLKRSSGENQPAGRSVIFSLCASALYSKDDTGVERITGIQGIAHDITERKRQQQEQQRLKEQLLKKQRIEAIGSLAGGVAHDFNNTMTGILSSVSILKDLHKTDPRTIELLAIIEKSVTHGHNLTKQLLGFAREGKYVVKPINLNTTLISCLKLFNPAQKNITVAENFAEDLWPVQADEGQMEQVLISLLLYSGESLQDSGIIELTSQNVVLDRKQADTYDVEEGNFVQITVVDNGPGMDTAISEHIFEPFFSTKSKDISVGLGLACAYGIIRHHGGVIQVKSVLEKGTIFKILLPAQPDAAIASLTEPVVELRKGEGNILVIDDNIVVADLLSQMLTLLGYRVETVYSGSEALEKFTENQQDFCLVFLDMLMPGMNGVETYTRLKERNPHINVVFSSGYTPDREVERIIREDNQLFLHKPFDLDKLSFVIHKSMCR